MLSVVYDLPPILSTNDPTVAKVNTFTQLIADYATTSNHLVEFFTWMKYVPSSISKWKREAEEGYKEYSEMFEGMFHDVENRIVLCYIPFLSPPVSFCPCYRAKETIVLVLLEHLFEKGSAIACANQKQRGWLRRCSMSLYRSQPTPQLTITFPPHKCGRVRDCRQ